MISDFTRRLLEWNDTSNSRSMPWRGERDPYRIWLSEIILQQTRVEQGWSYYEKFIMKYPSIQVLAAAADRDVYKLWEGLGYYSRCRNLLTTARTIQSEHDGIFPDTYDEIIKLKGIGPYTAAAIASFAFNEAKAVVDGNVQRVLARYFGVSTPIDSTAGKKQFASLASSLIDARRPAAFNQAIMDFGAMICRPKNPQCNNCILSDSCHAYLSSSTDRYPVKRKTITKTSRWFDFFVMLYDQHVYIRKRTAKDIWQNLHEFPLIESKEETADPIPAFSSSILNHSSYKLVLSSKPKRQQLTHQAISGRFHIVKLEKPANLPGDFMLVPKSNLQAYAFPRFITSFLEDQPI